MTRAKRSRDRGSTASSTPRWRWWPPSASAGTGGCCRAFATRAMGARTFFDWSVCCVSALVGSPSRLAMPAVLREHVPSMLGVGLLLAACGHDLTPAQPRAAKLAFLVEPTRTEGTVPIKPGPQVIILDQFGDTVRDATNTVTVALSANPSGATLTGTTTVTAAAGVASFSDLHIDPGERVHAPCHGTGARGRDERRVSNRPNHRSAERRRPHLRGDDSRGILLLGIQ